MTPCECRNKKTVVSHFLEFRHPLTNMRTTENRAAVIALFLALILLLILSCSKVNSSVDVGVNPIPALNSLNRDSLGMGNLGTARYVADSVHRDTVTFDPSSENYATISVTDANGYGWMLSIPPHALLSKQFITMTTLRSLDVSASGARIRSGVMLQPDGLQFLDKVMLTVKPPFTNPGTQLLFTFNNDGSHVQFANTFNTGMAWIWHFSCAGYDNSHESGSEVMDLYKQWAMEDYTLAMAAAKAFIKNNAPTPPAVPAISEYCRIFSQDQIDVDLYEFVQYFLEPYVDISNVLLGSMKTLQILDGQFNTADGGAACVAVLQKAEGSLDQLGSQYAGEKPPDHLKALIVAAVPIGRMIELCGGNSSGDPQITTWTVTIRDYYLNELKTNHEYRAFPVVIDLDRCVILVGGASKLDAIKAAMTFEVIVNTTFSSTWKSGTDIVATGDVVQYADVTGIVNTLTPPDFLWGAANNMTLESKSGSYTSSTGTVDLTGETIPCTVMLLNWDPCITKSFDVIVSGFANATNNSSTISGAASTVAFNDYMWTGTGAFMFTIPMTNNNAALGDATFSGSGSVDGGLFTGSGQIQITIKHTPK
jgi:hypothetical protein